MANFDLAITGVLAHEGGYVSDLQDLGGETNLGISKKAYPNEDIKNLTLERAKELYKRDYWDVIQGDKIYSQKIAESIFDFGVNAGNATSIKLVQEIVGTSVDGKIGPNTIAMINSFNEEKFIPLFKLAKIERYIEICNKRPDNKKFFFGWVTRTLR